MFYEPISHPQEKKSWFAKIIRALLQFIGLTNQPVVKVYHGYGNSEKVVVFGHVFSLSPIPRKTYRRNVLTNALSLLRSFTVVHIPNARVALQWQGQVYETKTAQDGFFRFECVINLPVDPGLHQANVAYFQDGFSKPVAEGAGWVMVPHPGQLAFVSDIDDTFLVSHSGKAFKKFYALLSKNAHSRKPFEGVVNHYNLLAKARMGADGVNPFFYVSSSEWNLYDFIKEFCRTYQLPEGVYLLNQLKGLTEVWKTGANKHSTKFMRITRVMEAYPHFNFVLLGDDSQMDPTIYASIAAHFPGRVVAVYLRHVYKKNLANVNINIQKITNAGVPVCHFEHSKEAIDHSLHIGII